VNSYKLKTETIEKLRDMREQRPFFPDVEKWLPRSGLSKDVLRKPIWQYYAKDRYSRRTDKWSTFAGNWSDDNSGAYYAPDWPAWRDLGDAHDVVRLNHTGWYVMDDWSSEVACGRVLQLPSRDGVSVYVPGIYDTSCDGVTVWPLDQYETPEECARAADEHARVYAEKAREYFERDQAEQQIAELHETAQQCIAEFKRLAVATRETPLPSTICDTVRNRLRQLRNECADAMREAAELRATL